MSIVNTIFFVLICIACIASIILDIGLFISWSKAKEKAFVANWLSMLAIALLCVVNLLPGERDLNSTALAVLMILVIPCEMTCLSPEGVRTAIFRNGGLEPVENLSYEYKKGRLGMEQLYIYKGSPLFGIFNFGIKKPKTVKMLADWYGKHGYENPLTK